MILFVEFFQVLFRPVKRLGQFGLEQDEKVIDPVGLQVGQLVRRGYVEERVEHVGEELVKMARHSRDRSIATVLEAHVHERLVNHAEYTRE